MSSSLGGAASTRRRNCRMMHDACGIRRRLLRKCEAFGLVCVPLARYLSSRVVVDG